MPVVLPTISPSEALQPKPISLSSLSVLELKDISLHVPAKPEPLTLLGEVSLPIRPGEFAAIVGPSGCGKSTLLKAIAGLTELSSGTLLWKGRDLETEGDFTPHEIGYIPQFSIAYELLTVEENLAASMRLRVRHRNAAASRAATAALLQQVGLQEIANRPVRLLSGGQRRRLALALELVTNPELLLCDEVTSGLDPKAENELVNLLSRLAKENARTVLSVTHSLTHLEAYDSVIVLHQGYLAFHGSPKHLTHYFQIDRPADLYAQLEHRTGVEWHGSWQKHREAFLVKPAAVDATAPLETAKAAKTLKMPESYEAALASTPSKSSSKTQEKETFFTVTLAPHPSKTEEIGEQETLPSLNDEEVTSRPELSQKAATELPHPPRQPGVVSQFGVLLARRWKLFFRDRSAIILQLLLILGFPILVVIFALNGLPQIQNLSSTHTGDIVKLFRENAAFVAQASRVGSLVSGLVMFQVVLLTLMASNNAAREIAGERLLFEKEKFGGVHPGAYVASKVVFLLGIVVAQSLWMALFVKGVCRFPGDPVAQVGGLIALNGAMTAVCLAISSLSRTPEQASITSIYLVGFQLPLSGAVLALPEALGPIARPFIAAYWGWSGYLQTLRDTRLYDVIAPITLTPLSPAVLCLWVLLGHIAIGLLVAYAGCKRSRWPQ